MQDYILSLNGSWKLLWLDNQHVCSQKIEITTYDEIISNGNRVIDAVVPGNFELDLQRSGLLEDPFNGKNILKLRQYEYVHMWYGCCFDYNESLKNTELVFEGIDTIAEIYLNGVFVGKTDNMLIPHRLSCVSLKKGRNEIVVHVLPSTIYARNLPSAPGEHALTYNYAGMRLRKAAHTFGWDIMPRAVSGGIWRDVSLVRKTDNRIEDVYLYTLKTEGEGLKSQVELYYRFNISEDDIARYSVQIEGECGNSKFVIRKNLWFTSGSLRFDIENSKLWWVKGQGEANLYNVRVSLLLDEECVNTRDFRFGIRTVELIRTSIIDENGDGDFYIRLNGRKIFIKGTNWVPADAFHSRDRERIPKILDLVKEIGCNAIRCWGGNVYEDDTFFDYCDENGLLVWQDFAFGCAIYPNDEEFLRDVSREVHTIVKKLRQHPSLGIWAGDNEGDQFYYDYCSVNRRDPNNDLRSRKAIYNVLLAEDPLRPYLPSSPYIDKSVMNYENGIKLISENHLWGPRDNFKGDFYVNSKAAFASEIGYHGCTAPKSMEKFISSGNLWPQNNDEWLIHCAPVEIDKTGPYAFRRELMFKQVGLLFGDTPDSLEEFALASQISQAEAMKFFIEMFRSQKWRRSGIIWWNIMDGWPQLSDAVVDYYFAKKLAFHYIRTAQEPLCLMLTEPNNGKQGLIACNDTQEVIKITYKITDVDKDTMVLSGEGIVEPDSATTLDFLDEVVGEQGIYLIEWQSEKHNGKNHYAYGKFPLEFKKYVYLMKKTGFLRADGFYTIDS